MSVGTACVDFAVEIADFAYVSGYKPFVGHAAAGFAELADDVAAVGLDELAVLAAAAADAASYHWELSCGLQCLGQHLV